MVDVLLVEDTIENVALFAIILKAENYTVDIATNGEEAIAYLEKHLKAGDGLPRIIVTDVAMPRMDGYELCFLIKNNPNYSHIPVIIFTAVWPELTKKMALTVAPDDYIVKPLDPRKFVEAVRAHIK